MYSKFMIYLYSCGDAINLLIFYSIIFCLPIMHKIHFILHKIFVKFKKVNAFSLNICSKYW